MENLETPSPHPRFLPMNQTHLATLQVSTLATIQEVVKRIDLSGRLSLALLVDEDKRLQAVITDGDVRRGLLGGLGLQDPAQRLLDIKAGMPNPQAVTSRLGEDPTRLLQLMQERHVRQIPLLDEAGRVADIITMNDLLPTQAPELRAVIMAGGFGTRLRPLTNDTPKPMLSVAGRPVMEWIVAQLRDAGIRRMNVTTHYKPEKIKEHFGDGRAFGVELNYVNEELPLGTGGALGLMEPPDGPSLVINGDVITHLDILKMLDFHQEHEADMTVAISQQQMEVPFGVVDCEGAAVRQLREKPKIALMVNAGIYLLEPNVYSFIPPGRGHFNMTDLIQWLLDAGRTVVGFPILEYWLDIGERGAFDKAQDHLSS
jgi:dTDP-glucose pyrophosphorylase/CBS domain-containing protein